ncbi:MAG: isopentenyl phosphate kinase [Anaerolineae bacterium]|nr:isopentenyl phosphate kinase [Anaerolineae bacterium]
MKLIKLGGSLITDKQTERSFRSQVMQRIAAEIAAALPHLTAPLIIGHGSGSFGHFAAKRHGTIDGVQTPAQWRGFAEVSLVASELCGLVVGSLMQAGVPALRVQPSASLLAQDGVPVSLSLDNLHHAVQAGLVPVVHGDVAFDRVRGGTIISTESLFTLLAQALPVDEIFLVGEVAGVLDEHGAVIPLITPDTVSESQRAIGGSRGTDVTGGMLTKVSDMVALVQARPHLTIHILDGLTDGVLHQTLLGAPTVKTTIKAR